MPAHITVSFVVPTGYVPGDYAVLHGDNAGGEGIDWDTPLTGRQLPLFPGGLGIHGWGHAPWGHFPWGHAFSDGPLGWGHLPWGHFPWGYGTALIEDYIDVTACGDYVCAFACYDSLGNLHEGTPDQTAASVHISPPPPSDLKFSSYNKTTDTLVLALTQ